MARIQTVYDAAGIKRTVRSVDAFEILAAGGSRDAPKGVKEVEETPLEAVEETESADETISFPKTFPGAAVFQREGIGYHAALRMSRDELIAVDGIGEKVADKVIKTRQG